MSSPPNKLNRYMRIFFFATIVIMVAVIFMRDYVNKELDKGPKYFDLYNSADAKIEYYDNGFVKYLGKLENGQRDGEWVFFDSTGVALRRDSFKNGALMASDTILPTEADTIHMAAPDSLAQP